MTEKRSNLRGCWGLNARGHGFRRSGMMIFQTLPDGWQTLTGRFLRLHRAGMRLALR